MNIKMICVIASLLFTFSVHAEPLSMTAKIEAAMFADHRSDANQSRNRYRHPVGTMDFFGLKNGMSVIEISPGGGWYTEILAPALRDDGLYIAASYDVDVPDQPEYRYRQHENMLKRFSEQADLYNQVKVAHYTPPTSTDLGAAGSADLVLTFRNSHGWVRDGLAEGIYADFFKVLKPGGVLGVVQHRAPDNNNDIEWARKGYVSESKIIEVAEKAGFKLEAKSEVNANPNDRKDYEQGVWTLPPSLRLGEDNQAKYLAIGESDRMTLRFRKPE